MKGASGSLAGTSRGASVDPGSATSETLYLHSTAPATAAEEAVQAGAGSGGPTMDTNAPVSPVPKIAHTSEFGNPSYYKNYLLSWWATPLHADVVGGTAQIWVSSPTNGTLYLYVLGDGGLVAGGAASAPMAMGGPSEINMTFTNLNASMGSELLLQVYTDQPGAAVLYDASTTPSSFTIALAPYTAPVVHAQVWNSTVGWGGVALINSSLANRETSIAIDPTNAQHMFLCSPSGVPNTQYRQSWFYQTVDNGSTWQYTTVKTNATDLRQQVYEGGDCDVAFDAAGTMYTADTWLGDLSIGHSFDGGKSWAGTPLAGTSPIVDRPWIVGGAAGVLHVTYQDVQFAMPTAIWYTVSNDSGSTFRPAVPVVISDPNAPLSWEGNFVVSPDGRTIDLVYTTRQLGTLAGQGTDSESVHVAQSNDGGLTWSTALIATMPHAASYLYPSIGRDAAGGLHVVFASSTDTDQPIWYSFSNDGQSWAAPVPIARGLGCYAPWVVGGSSAGTAAIEWLGSTSAVNAPNRTADWYFYAARETGAETGSPLFAWTATTSNPIFHGQQGATPEFNQLRLDKWGNIRLGESAYFTNSAGGTGWAEFYQSETGGPSISSTVPSASATAGSTGAGPSGGVRDLVP
ncbi:MAG: sialidase family protein [Thermoplasmatota archaeon]